MTDNSTEKTCAISLRALEPSDLDRLYIWENLSETRKYGCTYAPLSRHQLWEYIRTYDAEPIRSGQLRLMVTDTDGTPVGTVELTGIDPRHRHAQIGIMIEPGKRRRGYGKSAVEMMCRYCRDNLGLHQLLAQISVDNEPSLALFQASGFTSCGTLPDWVRRDDGSFADVTLFGKALQ